jgi:hypothetical protein
VADTTFIKGGPIGARRELGIAGKPLHSLFRQLRALIERELGQRAADFLALPVADPYRAHLDWYAPVEDGRVVRFAELAPEQQTRIAGEIRQFVEGYAAVARKYQSASQPSQREIGAALELIARMPLMDEVYVVDETPVAAYWGFEHDPAAEAASRRAWERFPATVPPKEPPLRRPDQRPPRRIETIVQWAHSGLARLHLVGSPLFWSVAGLSALVLAASAYGFAEHHSQRPDVGALAMLQSLQSTNDELKARLAQTRLDIATRRLRCWQPQPFAPPQTNHPPTPPSPPPPSQPEIEGRLERAQAGGGVFNISLGWNSVADLDLHVIDNPDHCQINFSKKTGCGGGVLDVDANVRGTQLTPTPVENVTWKQPPPPGTYEVEVVNYRLRATDDTHFAVLIKKKGEAGRFIEGMIKKGTAVVRIIDYQYR